MYKPVRVFGWQKVAYHKLFFRVNEVLKTPIRLWQTVYCIHGELFVS